MVSQTVAIKNPTGLHLRPAGVFCNLANKYSCKVNFSVGKEQDLYNAKSILSVLGACVKCGDEITVSCDGADEAEALEAIIARIGSGLEE